MKGALHQPRRHKHLAPVLAFLKIKRASDISVVSNGHLHIRFSLNGRAFHKVMGGHPKHPEVAAKNTIADLRHMIEVRP